MSVWRCGADGVTSKFDLTLTIVESPRLVAGMIEYAFLQDHLKGGALVVLTLSLVVYAVHVPMLIAFTVARYDVATRAGASLAPRSDH